ncbi:MAG: carboxyl transferase domain-containing protein, partial [Lachnospiraceae bacterium]|nr:carboxyl transferase domain-containing protein [Lachnospiraceae bacterium]
MSERKNSLAAQRIQRLLDENSFVELGAGVTSRNTDFNLSKDDTPSDGVITGHGLIDGNLVFVYSQDNSVLGGTIGEMHARKIRNIYRMAVKMGAPVIGFLDCGGVRLQESFDALESIGSIYQEAVKASGVVPEITAVVGKCGGGMSTLAGVSDFVFMTEDAKLFLNAPDAIPGNNVDQCDSASAKFQYENTGLVDGIGSEDEIIDSIRKLVTILPGSNLEDGCFNDCEDDLNRASEITTDSCPCEIAKELSDNHVFVETKKGYATSFITGFIQLDGQTVGVVGNKEDKLKTAGCRKAADFIRFCDAFSIP